MTSYLEVVLVLLLIFLRQGVTLEPWIDQNSLWVAHTDLDLGTAQFSLLKAGVTSVSEP